MRGALRLLLFCVLACAGASASAQTLAFTTSEKSFLSNYMQIFGSAQAPAGFTRFCEQNPARCQAKGQENRIAMTPDSLGELYAINKYVNGLIAPATDSELYGVSEYWALPTTRGDCEDYALLKQKLLTERGWPTSALLLTVVRDDRGEGHAILTARTNAGDLILDNKIDDIRLWNSTTYKYIMRQSYLDPKVWISLDSGDTKPPVSIAGVETEK